MPNWCKGELRIKGPAIVLAALVAEIEGHPEKAFCSALVPMPEGLRNSDSPPCIGYAVKYGSEATWQNVATYPWIKEANEGRAPASRLETLAVLERVRPGEEAKADKVVEVQREFGCTDWYEWAQQNWGTKWGDCRTSIEGNAMEGKVLLKFESAWAPPLRALDTIAAAYPLLEMTLKFWEGGMGFRGLVKWKKGVRHDERSYSYAGPRGG